MTKKVLRGMLVMRDFRMFAVLRQIFEGYSTPIPYPWAGLSRWGLNWTRKASFYWLLIHISTTHTWIIWGSIETEKKLEGFTNNSEQFLTPEPVSHGKVEIDLACPPLHRKASFSCSPCMGQCESICRILKAYWDLYVSLSVYWSETRFDLGVEAFWLIC